MKIDLKRWFFCSIRKPQFNLVKRLIIIKTKMAKKAIMTMDIDAAHLW